MTPAADVVEDGSHVEVVTTPGDFEGVKRALEAQGSLEWCKCLWAEITDPTFRLETRDAQLQELQPSLHIVDAKSMWDHVRSSSPSAGVEDKRAGIDLVGEWIP